MRSPQYIPAEPVYCWGSGSVEQASEVALEEQEVKAEVELVVEAKWQEECCIGASTPTEEHSIEAATGYVSDMDEREVE